jgi:hypothetical protein
VKAIDPDAIIAELLELDREVRLERYYGERSLFYNPGGTAPLGVMFASIKEHDGPNDRASRLSRPEVYRLAFQLTRDTYAEYFGSPPARPPRGGVIALDLDLSALNRLTPHPVYAWMRWVQILSPTPRQFAAVRPRLEESLSLAREKWGRRQATVR